MCIDSCGLRAPHVARRGLSVTSLKCVMACMAPVLLTSTRRQGHAVRMAGATASRGSAPPGTHSAATSGALVGASLVATMSPLTGATLYNMV